MGDNAIHYLGHVKMMSAVQPFLSGAISKTVNMPEDVTVEDVEQLHLDAWKMGLKAVAIYRDNCKVAQPLSMAKKETKEADKPAPNAHTAETPEQVMAAAAQVVAQAAPAIQQTVSRYAVRRELPKIRNSKTFKFTVGGSRCYMTVGEYEDGTPGELFVSTAKMGSTLRGVMDSFAVAVSYGLQFGVPLKQYVRNFTNTSFAPNGVTDDPDIRTASSIIDYIFRRLGKTYLSFDDQLEVGLASLDDMPMGQASLLDSSEVEDLDAKVVAEEVAAAEQSIAIETPEPETKSTAAASTVTASTSEPVSPPVSAAPGRVSTEAEATVGDASAPLCFNCGNQTQRSGTCYVCTSCGSTTGCS
jgi:ribonucleoside-diphosphate reductase alpha chain